MGGRLRGPRPLRNLLLLCSDPAFDRAAAEPQRADHHRLHAVRAHLHELAGDQVAATEAYREAARRAPSTAERRHLEREAVRLAP